MSCWLRQTSMASNAKHLRSGSVDHGKLAHRKRSYRVARGPSSRRRSRRRPQSGTACAATSQFSGLWPRTLRWASSWATRYSISAGAAMITRQLKCSVPSGAQLAQRLCWSRMRISFGRTPSRPATRSTLAGSFSAARSLYYRSNAARTTSRRSSPDNELGTSTSNCH